MSPLKKFGQLLVIAFSVLSCSDKTETKIQSLPSPTAADSGEPYLVTHNDVVYMSWLETQDTVTFFKYSILDGDAWSTPTQITSGSTWFVNWADYPTMAINRGSVIAHYLEESGPDKYSYDAKFVISTGQDAWSAPRLLNEDGKEAEHGFVSIVPYKENFFAAWLDGRNATMEGMEGMDHSGHGAMSLRAAIIDVNGKKLDEWLLDERVCDCCQTSAAITENGPVVVYRDRSDDEIRDMSIIRWKGDGWSDPMSIYNDNWEINGCPVNGPRTSSRGNNLAVTWFTAADDSTQVKTIFSRDGGATFNKPILLNKAKTLGRVDVELIGDDSAVVTWIENDSIQFATVNSSGMEGEARALTAISSSRASGFPQMTKVGSRLVFAWKDVSTNSVKTAMMEIK